MGKTKTAFVGDITEKSKKSSEQKYKEKRERQAVVAKASEGLKKVHIAGLKGGQRIKMVEADLPVEALKEEPRSAEASQGLREPKIRSKKYKSAKAKIDKSKTYPLPEALKLVKETSYSKFDGTMELHLVARKVGIGAQVDLPYSAGKVKKVEIATESTIKKLSSGKIDFDVLVATPEMMPKLVPFAKFLGPKGLMPNPKNGTLVKDAKKASGFNASTVSLKTEKEAPLIHTTIGKVSQKDSELTANLEAIIKAIGEKQIVKAYLKATMSPSVKVSL